MSVEGLAHPPQQTRGPGLITQHVDRPAGGLLPFAARRIPDIHGSTLAPTSIVDQPVARARAQDAGSARVLRARRASSPRLAAVTHAELVALGVRHDHPVSPVLGTGFRPPAASPPTPRVEPPRRRRGAS